MHTVKPAQNQLFCKPVPAETKSASGILLTSRATEPPRIAEVINTGSNVTEFNPHDKIIYKSYTTTEIKLNNEEFFLVTEDDVLGTVIESQ